MERPSLTTNTLVTAAAMLVTWLACDWALSHVIASGTPRSIAVALAASCAGALVLWRIGPNGSWSAIAKSVKAVRAMKEGDFSARAPVPERSALAPLSQALNELAASLASSVDSRQKELDLLSGILDGMAEGVIVFDRAGSIVLANLAARRIAVSSDDVIGKSAIEALRNATLAQAVSRALEKGEGGVREVEMGGVLPRRLLVRLSERAHAKDGGGVIAVLHDVTDLRRLETIRTDFVANVSHELRTPVTAIASAADTLLGGALGDPKDAAEFVEMIERNAQRLRRLVEDLLDLSKIESKAYKLSPAVLALAPLFAQAQKLVENAAERRKMRVLVQVKPEVSAWIDRHAFEQVLGNLLDNAVKYAGEGATVSLGAQPEGDTVVISVADTGAGIAPQHLSRLFERFYRADAGRSREMGGTGLGLAIVKHLVEAMEGTISVKSTLGRGTTFTLVLPRVPVIPAERAEPATAA